MIINIHAGHAKYGNKYSGADGYINESKENRKVKDLLIKELKNQGHTIYDCTVDSGTGVTDILKKIVAKCNAHKADLDISIHFNAGGGQGVECYLYDDKTAAKTYADNITKAIASLGFINRGVKYNKDLYVLKHTLAPAILIECCFVDSKTDCNKYSDSAMASAIAKAITGKAVIKPTAPKVDTTPACYPKYTGLSSEIDRVFEAIGVPAAYRGSYSKRRPIAQKNGYPGNNYTGAYAQNVNLVNLAKKGILKRV